MLAVTMLDKKILSTRLLMDKIKYEISMIYNQDMLSVCSKDMLQYTTDGDGYQKGYTTKTKKQVTVFSCFFARYYLPQGQEPPHEHSGAPGVPQAQPQSQPSAPHLQSPVSFCIQ
jgi:hypothetical protein